MLLSFFVYLHSTSSDTLCIYLLRVDCVPPLECKLRPQKQLLVCGYSLTGSLLLAHSKDTVFDSQNPREQNALQILILHGYPDLWKLIKGQDTEFK